MLSLIIVSLVAGVCYGQDPGKFSDCPTVQTIGSDCAMSHLGYLKNLNQDHYMKMQMIAMIDMPEILLDMLDTICNDTMGLKAYYKCAFVNVTACLENKNSTQVIGAPDATRIADGVADMCSQRADMNKTCVTESVDEVKSCFAKFMGEQPKAQGCQVSEKLIDCAETFSSCKGGDVMKDFIIDARPATCQYTGSAQQFLPCLLLLLGTLLAHFFKTQ